MKNKILLVLLCSITTLFSQVSDIAHLASGSLQRFSQIIDLDNSVYGYFAIYRLDDVSKTEEKFEYVLLDKNLNKVANGEFVDPVYKRFRSSFFYPQKMGDEILITKAYNYIGAAVQTAFSQSAAKFGFTSHRILNLNNNEMSKPFYYQDKELVEGYRDIKKIKSITKKQKAFDYPVAFNEGFFIAEDVKDKAKYYKEIKSLKAYDANRNEKWSYEYNPENKQLEYSFFILDEDNVVLHMYDFKKKARSFHSLNPQTGALNFVYELENKKSDYNHMYTMHAFDDKFVIVGKYSDYSSFTGYDQEKAKGYFRIELDKSGKELSKKYLPWKELSSVIKMKDNGKLEEDNYRLSSKRFFVFKNGKVSIINEKRKQKKTMGGMLKVKTTDFVIFNFDKDFNIVSKDIIEKEKTKSYWVQTDYLFSQKINDDNGAAFFYVDNKTDEESGDKKRILGIVYLKDGKVTEEQIPAKGLDIYRAKEGYILFREINRDEDIDEVRLERLNF